MRWCALIVLLFVLGGCSGEKKAPKAPKQAVEDTLTDPVCRDEAIRLCLHRFPAPDVERKKYDACLTEEYAECLAK